jgi:hypothetical protein
MTKRIIAMPAADFRALISLTAKSSSKDKLFPESLSSGTAAQLAVTTAGCFIATLDDAGAAEVGAMLSCVAWRGTHGECNPGSSANVSSGFCGFGISRPFFAGGITVSLAHHEAKSLRLHMLPRYLCCFASCLLPLSPIVVARSLEL